MLGVQAAGLQLEKSGAVKVDKYSQTTVPHIYAVGDVTERLALTPVALMESVAFAATVFGGKDQPGRPFERAQLYRQRRTRLELRPIMSAQLIDSISVSQASRVGIICGWKRELSVPFYQSILAAG